MGLVRLLDVCLSNPPAHMAKLMLPPFAGCRRTSPWPHHYLTMMTTSVETRQMTQQQQQQLLLM